MFPRYSTISDTTTGKENHVGRDCVQRNAKNKKETFATEISRKSCCHSMHAIFYADFSIAESAFEFIIEDIYETFVSFCLYLCFRMQLKTIARTLARQIFHETLRECYTISYIIFWTFYLELKQFSSLKQTFANYRSWLASRNRNTKPVSLPIKPIIYNCWNNFLNCMWRRDFPNSTFCL